MELSWLMRIRIALAAGLGVLAVGVLCWPMVVPAEPLGIVTIPQSQSFIILLAVSAFTALIAYFICWPFGSQIATIAVPAGLALWSIRTGTIATQLQQINPDVAARQGFFTPLKFEAFFWMLIILAGFAGVLISQLLFMRKTQSAQIDPAAPKSDAPSGLLAVLADVFNPVMIQHKKQKQQTQKDTAAKSAEQYLNILIAIIISVLIGQFGLKIFAQDVKMFDGKLGSVVAQPTTAQIVFAVLVTFGLAAFVVKTFFNASFIWPAISSVFVMIYSNIAYTKPGILEQLVKNWPAVFLPNSAIAILPVQMVSLGALGAIAGYWLAIRWDYWRKHELKR